MLLAIKPLDRCMSKDLLPTGCNATFKMPYFKRMGRELVGSGGIVKWKEDLEITISDKSISFTM
jgi:hypothetical protein